MGFSEAYKEAFWKLYISETEAEEKPFIRTLKKLFAEQENEVIRNLVQFYNADYNEDKANEEFANSFKPLIASIYEAHYRGTIEGLRPQNPHMEAIKQEEFLDQEALSWISSRSLSLAKMVNGTTKEELRLALAEGFREGESIPQMTKRIKDYYRNGFERRAPMVARTETITAASQGAERGYRDMGVIKVEWYCAIDERLCESCEALHENEYPIGEGPRPALHPNCLLPDNKVTPFGLVAISRAWYEGRAIEIQTRRGHRLTVTPNHPILTPEGFIKAQFLKEGEYIISSDFPQRIAAIVNPNNDEIPSFVEDIWGALSVESDMLRATVPVSPIDFNGDASGFNGKVDIVYSDSFLRDSGYAQIEQHLSEAIFRERGTNPGSSFVSDSVMPFGYFGFGLPSDGIMSRCHKCGKFFRGHSFKSQQISVSPTTGFDASFKESLTYNNSFQPSRFRERKFRFSRDIPLNQIGGSSNTQLATRDAALVEQAVKSRLAYIPLANKFLRRFASLITPDEIIKIRNFQFSNHIYDLQSVNRLYHASGIIVKNCRCVILPVV